MSEKAGSRLAARHRHDLRAFLCADPDGDRIDMRQPFRLRSRYRLERGWRSGDLPRFRKSGASAKAAGESPAKTKTYGKDALPLAGLNQEDNQFFRTIDPSSAALPAIQNLTIFLQ